MKVHLTGQHVKEVQLAPSLDITTDGDWLITIEADYVLERPGADDLRTDRGDEGDIVAWLSEHIGSPILGFDYGEHEDLRLSLESGILRAPPTEKFEAWTIAGPGHELVVSMPGGELAVWTAGGR